MMVCTTDVGGIGVPVEVQVKFCTFPSDCPWNPMLCAWGVSA